MDYQLGLYSAIFQSYFLHLAVLLDFLDTAPAADFHQAIEALANAARAFSSTVSKGLSSFSTRVVAFIFSLHCHKSTFRRAAHFLLPLAVLRKKVLSFHRCTQLLSLRCQKVLRPFHRRRFFSSPRQAPYTEGLLSASSSGIKLPRPFFDRSLSSLQEPARICGVKLGVKVPEVGCLVRAVSS